MPPRTFTLSRTFLFLGLCLILVSGTAISQEVSPGCEAAMDKAAGELSECLLKAEAQFAKGGDEGAKEAARARCGERFDQASTRAMSRFGADQCTPASLVTAMEERTTSYAEAMALEAAGVPSLELLFVQSSDGAELTESTLTLTGVNDNTGWFANRPFRAVGEIATEEFISQWGEGEVSFAEVPPNADITCEVEGEVVNFVVELMDPVRDGAQLTYSVNYLSGTAPSSPFNCTASGHLFIDFDNLPPCTMQELVNSGLNPSTPPVCSGLPVFP